jgi:pimeloyl-ACP methyl ester carboxylesterase
MFTGIGRLVARALVLAVALTGVTGSVAIPASAGATGDAATLVWRSCHGGDVECARFSVPLDDTNPADTRTIDLALERVPARDPDRRIGSLVVNPGGPGAPGADFAPEIAGSLPNEIQDRFDIVGFDPRGTGKSAGVDCGDRYDSLYALDFDPDTPEERQALDDANRALVESCVRRDGDRLPFLTTDRAARDMDRIRAALGDDRLTYLGYSYGTLLGAQYAAQFPERVRALVLDGAVDPALDGRTSQLAQAKGFERSLDLFLADCAHRPSCAFHGGDHPGAAYDALRSRADRHPIAAGRGRRLNGTLFDIGIAQLLYAGESSWREVADVLSAAERGDGSALVGYADLYTGRSDNGTYNDLQESFLAIGCADGPPIGGVDGLRAIEEEAAEVAPRLGRSVVNNSLACAFWPVPAPPAQPLYAPGAPPILVIGTRNDPATPLSGARALARELGSGVLMIAPGAQHTAFASGNACVDRAVARYFVDLGPPKNGKRC